MSNVIPLATPGHNRLDSIKRQILTGYERTTKGHQEWVEGSVQMGAALREGRELIPADISFSDWIKQNELDFLSGHDRAALINMAADLATMRAVLSETTSRDYRRIWGTSKERFDQMAKPDVTPRRNKRKVNMRGSRMTFRSLKLGDEAMEKIKGTSLDSAAEMDELVVLNRGAAPGELLPMVKQLVEDAAAGKDVSALAESAKLANGPVRKIARSTGLIGAWRKRMVSEWERSNEEEQLKLLVYLVMHSKWEDKDDLMERVIDDQHAATKK